jgi:hypothetical protein
MPGGALDGALNLAKSSTEWTPGTTSYRRRVPVLLSASVIPGSNPEGHQEMSAPPFSRRNASA